MAILDFYYDFGSPNVYFAREALKDVSGRTGLTVREHPVLIGGIFKLTHNRPPWMAHGQCANRMAYMQLEIKRFIEDYGLTKFRFNSAFPVKTLLSMRTAIAAQDAGVHDRFVEPVFKAVWEDDMNISDPEVLTTVLNGAGLNGEALVAATRDQAIKDKLAAATQAVVDRGAFGLPTYFLDEDMYFGKDRVWMIERKISG
ncbi:MAG: 2-hydroxychromene-2-carboxylate isomerase [Hyphomonadaceae bacterium]|nr:2-hydroxychromene-2-carboxylate isomerase [Hyphomonadaceae bacterium]MBC6412182.1 2-hydroxychromene-2-carboxylate isomerase [Hyphomonadaceae bacterium]